MYAEDFLLKITKGTDHGKKAKEKSSKKDC